MLLTYRKAAALLAGLLLLAGCDDGGPERARPDPSPRGTVTGAPGSMSSPAAFTEADVAFVDGLLARRRQAVAMATAMRDQARDREVAGLASGVVTVYPGEIERATALLTGWGRRPSGPAGSASAWPSAPAGAELDLRFVSSLLENQRAVQRLASARLAAAGSGTVTQLATTTAGGATAQITGLEATLRRLKGAAG
ncbi:DUF305 domain-containing protein [Micromonospora sp. NPDC049836]|uniref:DUF305 domain-containing protein n=1 Tax=Micromonospora sp. NPDC049836 TaxID=3364274 RepID=UPI0037A79A3D